LSALTHCTILQKVEGRVTLALCMQPVPKAVVFCEHWNCLQCVFYPGTSHAAVRCANHRTELRPL